MKNSFRFSNAVLAVALATGSFAWTPQIALAEDAVKYPEMKTASGFSRAIQHMTGFTLVSGWIANRVLRHEIREHVQGKLDSKLSLYSGTDLLSGKAKTIRISGKDLLVGEFIPVSAFSFENKSGMPIYVRKSSRPFLLRPVDFQVSAVITENDLNRMFQSKAGREKLTGMTVDIPPFGKQSMDIIDPAVDIDGGKVIIRAMMNMHDAPKEYALPMRVTGRITAEKARLKLSDMKIDIEGIEDTEPVARLVENYFSEIVNLNSIKISRHRVKVAVEKTDLANDQLNLQATLTVEPERKTLQKYLSSLEQPAKQP